jgi:hypothetical protein
VICSCVTDAVPLARCPLEWEATVALGASKEGGGRRSLARSGLSKNFPKITNPLFAHLRLALPARARGGRSLQRKGAARDPQTPPTPSSLSTTHPPFLFPSWGHRTFPLFANSDRDFFLTATGHGQALFQSRLDRDERRARRPPADDARRFHHRRRRCARHVSQP